MRQRFREFKCGLDVHIETLPRNVRVIMSAVISLAKSAGGAGATWSQYLIVSIEDPSILYAWQSFTYLVAERAVKISNNIKWQKPNQEDILAEKS